MSVLDVLRPSRMIESANQMSDLVETKAQLVAYQEFEEFVTESMAELELAFEDQGWTRLLWGAQNIYSRDGLLRVEALAEVMAIANPLIKRGLQIRTAYVWGQGCQISVRDDDVNVVVQDFMSNQRNKDAYFGTQARETCERTLGTGGNLFIALHTSQLTGRVQVRTIPLREITKKIKNPDDRQDVWFYLREWTSETIGSDGSINTEHHATWHPDVAHTPFRKTPFIDGIKVKWNAPIVHEHVNGLAEWDFGIGDAFAALPYAKAYKEFIENWVDLVKNLSRFAFALTAENKSQSQTMRSKLAQHAQTNDAGGTVQLTPGQRLEAVPKTGATIDSESGKPVAALVAGALGIPVTQLLSDPGQTGARAVAETLDKPTELGFKQRQDLHAETINKIIKHVIDQAVIAPQGPLRGHVTWDKELGDRIVTVAGDPDLTADIVFPPLSKESTKEIIDALVAASGTEVVPDAIILRLILLALNVDDVDALMDELTDDDGNLITPPDENDPYRQTPDDPADPNEGANDDGDQ